MARNNSSIENIQKTLDLAGQELRILHQISQSISSTLDLDQVLRQIVDLVIDVTRGDACLVYLLDDARDNLDPARFKESSPPVDWKDRNAGWRGNHRLGGSGGAAGCDSEAREQRSTF